MALLLVGNPAASIRLGFLSIGYCKLGRVGWCRAEQGNPARHRDRGSISLEVVDVIPKPQGDLRNIGD
jgi:hypothetical protein